MQFAVVAQAEQQKRAENQAEFGYSMDFFAAEPALLLTGFLCG